MIANVIVSDVHLGSPNCQAGRLRDLLERILSRSIETSRLILNGDVFDSIDFRRLDKDHWKILSLIRRIAEVIEVVWIAGNHDGPAEVISHMLGVTVWREYVFVSGGKKFLCLHGDVFDSFIQNRPMLTWVADQVYRMLISIDRTHDLARWAKSGSKTFLRNVALVRDGAIARARELGCEAVVCGHTHVACENAQGWENGHGFSPIRFHNSGCWTELPCHYLTVDQGEVRLHAACDPE